MYKDLPCSFCSLFSLCCSCSPLSLPSLFCCSCSPHLSLSFSPTLSLSLPSILHTLLPPTLSRARLPRILHRSIPTWHCPSLLAPCSSPLAPRSSLLAPCSSLLAPRSVLLAPCSSRHGDSTPTHRSSTTTALSPSPPTSVSLPCNTSALGLRSTLSPRCRWTSSSPSSCTSAPDRCARRLESHTALRASLP